MYQPILMMYCVQNISVAVIYQPTGSETLCLNPILMLCMQNILVAGKPHLGTDRLVRILQAFRTHLTALGVTIHFGTCVTDIVLRHDRAIGVQLKGQYVASNFQLDSCPHSFFHQMCMLGRLTRPS